MTFAIYVVQHKPSLAIPDENFIPILCGTKTTKLIEPRFVTDDTGDHIAEKNVSFCELTAMYWVWKNAPVTDHVGFMHYRRHLDFKPDHQKK